MPYPKPLNVVVGGAVEFDSSKVLKEHPEDANLDMFVDAYHEQYVAALKKLWNDHKDKYAQDRRKSLEIVE
jgi:2-acylglycerol O-acyltransferase 2